MQPEPPSEPIRPEEATAASEPLRAKWRDVMAGGLYRTGALRVIQRLSRSYELQSAPGRKWPRWHRVSRPKFAILCYHRVGTEGIPLFDKLPAEVFESQVRLLRQRYRIISLDTLCAELQEPGGIQQSVAITFDDGYRDLYSQAFPILQRYQIPATIFVTVGSIESGQVPWYDRIFLALDVWPSHQLDLDLDRPRRFCFSTPGARFQVAARIVQCLRRLPDWRRRECCADLEKQIALPQEKLAERMLTWEQIQTMHRAGIAFGSHTMTHPVISRLTPAQMEEELLQPKQVLERKLGSPVRDFAFPFGQPADCGTTPAAVLARCGYRSAATTVWGINAPGADPYRLRRVQVGEERCRAMFVLKLNQLFLRAEEVDPLPGSLAPSSEQDEAPCGSERFAS